MNRYFIYLAYNGANYCGWQVQPNGISIQETIEKALSTLLRTPTPIVGAGRTDAGVHAKQMVAHFDTDADNVEALAERLNRILPKDIAIHRIVRVADEAHARFDAVSRLYRYYITTAKDPFMHPFKYKIHGSLGLEMMNRCAEILFEYEDFTSFSKLHTDVKTNNCIILQASWEASGSDYVFTIKANRFLRNMVRAIVGTLIDAGRGKLDEAGMRSLIEARNRCAAGHSVPGNALFLEEIEYPEKIFIE
jgi:tRNA pseudouridine38-40 synthase